MMRAAIVAALALAAPLTAQIAVRGAIIHPVAGPPIENGVILILGGKIARVGPAADVAIPDGIRVLDAAVVTPGLIDARTTVGFSGILNQPHDQDQIERSEPIQPELRAIDAFNPDEELVGWVRRFGTTTIHTGHAPGGLVTGQTLIAKTTGDVLVETAMIAATLGRGATGGKGKAPGTRAKAVALLRGELIRAREYDRKRGEPDVAKRAARDLRLEALARVLAGDVPLLVTANEAEDIATALRLKEEFGVRLVLDGAAEWEKLEARLRDADIPILIHPPMARASGELESASMAAGARLAAAGLRFAFETGYESYVPKTRVVLFEAAVAAGHGLPFGRALEAITRDAAQILGIDDRVGTIEPGKDADLALFDGDPFEYTSHVTAVIIDGKVVEKDAH